MARLLKWSRSGSERSDVNEARTHPDGCSDRRRRCGILRCANVQRTVARRNRVRSAIQNRRNVSRLRAHRQHLPVRVRARECAHVRWWWRARWRDESAQVVRRILLVLAVLGARTANAQSPKPQPDSTAEQLFLRTILASKDYRVLRAAGDTGLRIFRVQYRLADSARWSQYTDQILTQLHARRMADADTRTYELVITGLRISGDTLIGAYSIGDRQRCPMEPWIGGATGYEMRAFRVPTGWTEPVTRATGVGDTRACRTR